MEMKSDLQKRQTIVGLREVAALCCFNQPALEKETDTKNGKRPEKET